MFGGQSAGVGFNFKPAASSAGTAPASGFSFGANTSGTSGNAGFTFGAPATTATTTSAGVGGFSFGGSSGMGGGLTGLGAASGVTAAGSAGSTGFNFGAAATKVTSATVNPTPTQPTLGFSAGTSTTTAAASTGGGFSFGAPASSFTGLGANNNMSAPGTTLTTTAPVSGVGLPFGQTAPKSTATAAPTLGGLLGAPATQTASLSTASATSTAPGFSLGAPAITSVAASSAPGFSFGTASLGQPSATTAATSLSSGGSLALGGFGLSATSTSATATSTANSVPSLSSGQKQMTFRQLEDTINKWTTELEDQEKSFLDQATQVNAWDRIVMENGEKIISLNKDLERVKLEQQKLDHELDFVHSQQKELEELVAPLESALDELPPISHTQHAHLEREHTYTLAESLDSQLKRMSQDMKEIVERLNSNNIKPDENDPLQQITKILNAHVVSLMWVDRNSANLQRRAEEIAKMMDYEKKEQEKNFRLAYS